MTTTRTYFDLAQLAEASYGNHESGNTLEEVVKDPDYIAEAFSHKQAEELDDHWDVIAHQPDTDSGFSSTLFRNTDEGDGGYVLAIRGTKEIWNDLLLTDIADIVADGIAINQTIDLYNEWRRLTETGAYQAAFLDVLVAETADYLLARLGQSPINSGLGASEYIQYLRSRNDIIIDEPSGRIFTIKFASSTTVYDDHRTTGLGLGAEISAHGVTVTGHSLGGHLAAAFTRLFSSVGADAVTINGAGFATGAISGLTGNATSNIRNLFSMLGGATQFSGESILNLYGDKNFEFVTMSGPGLYQQGGHEAAFIEQAAVLQDVLGHGSAQMTDSLAVYDLFQTLQVKSTREAQIQALDTLKTVFETVSRSAANSLESMVNSISRALNIDIRISEPAVDDREALYTAIYGIRDTEAFRNLTDKFNFVEFEPVPEAAHTDFSSFLSLFFLLPFQMQPKNAAVAEQLRVLHGSLGEAWREDSTLTQSQRAQGLANFSDQFLEDRALMLSTMFPMNAADRSFGNLSQKTKFTALGNDPADTLVFDGDGSGYPGAPAMFDPDRARYVFGSDAAENAFQIVASNNNDHLYGMGGSDVIEGLAGSDHLEGGAGSDILLGGIDGDVLVGGDGNDALRGGEDDDLLFGGAGADRLLWLNGDGDDFVGDYDDAGDRIIVNGIDLATLNFKRRSTDSPYYVDPNQPGITLHYDGGQLTIRSGSGADAGSITVTQYAPATGANFGILLNDYSAGPDPVNSVVVAALGVSGVVSANETRPYAYDRQRFNQRGVNWATASITFNAANVSNYSGGSLHGTFGGAFEGGPVDDFLIGNGDQNALHGHAGKDRIDGGAGNDFLEGGAGADLLFGGHGADILFGSARAGLASSLDEPTSYNQFYLSQIIDAQGDINILAGGADGDFVSGGEHTDYLDGGAGIDYLLGGTGADFINGGADRDIIYGDSALHNRYVELTEGVASERLEIAFADGGDDVGQYNDVLHGGGGNDTVWGELGDDEIHGGDGDDNLIGDRYLDSSYFAAELPAFGDSTPALGVSLHGNDKLYGGAGADYLIGLAGNDQLYGGAGVDSLSGGAGDDSYILSVGDGLDVIQDNEGKHTLVFIGIAPGDLSVKFNGNQVFVGRGSQDGFFLQKSQWNNVRIALNTPDAIVERSRLDTAYFDGAGNLLLTLMGTRVLTEAERDQLVTVDTTDTRQPKLVVKAGVHQVQLEGIDGGSAGGRLRIVKNGVEIVTELAARQLQPGREYLSLANGLVLGVAGFAGSISGTKTGDWIVGSSGADIIRGYAGNDILVGGGGIDELDGGQGFDAMIGGDGDDVLRGGTSVVESDYFDGGRGSDLFYGGAGSDTYRFVAGDGRDRILDGGGQHAIEFGPDVNPASVKLYHTGTSSSHFRLEYGSGDAVVSDGVTSSHWISGIKVGGLELPLVQRSEMQNGTFHDTRWHDVFEPGAGSDVIHVQGWGNDAIRLATGDGQDVVSVGQDRSTLAKMGEIRFAASVDLASISYRFSGIDATINYGSSDQITLDTATSVSSSDNALLRFTLTSEADPNWIPVIRATGVLGNLYGTHGKDKIIGSLGHETIFSGQGNDIIEAGDGADVIVLNELYPADRSTGIGRKHISGQRGDDKVKTPLLQGMTFSYQRGDGNDTIEYDWTYSSRHPYRLTADRVALTAKFQSHGEDTVAFGPGITLDDLRFTRYSDSLSIQLKDGSGSVRINGFFHAWDAERGPFAAVRLFSIFTDPQLPTPSSLIHPAILGALPRTPIAYLQFADGAVFNLATELEARLQISNATLLGTEGADTLSGARDGEIIHGLGGDDEIFQDFGSGIVDAGDGADSIFVVGAHVVDGGSGNDQIQATGNNVIRAGAGQDTLVISGNNVINAGPGLDVVSLMGGHNIVEFGPGHGLDFVGFTVRTGLDSTIIKMAAGLTVADIRVEKVVQSGTESIDIILNSTGDTLPLRAMVANAVGDAFSIHPRATVNEVRFSNGTTLSGEQLFAMTQRPRNRIDGTPASDWLAGTSGDDDFFGGPGSDVMYGAAGNDHFYVQGNSQGADRIIGGEGIDAIFGGSGNDVITLLSMPATDSIEKIDGQTGLNAIAGTVDNNLLDFTSTALLGIHHIDGNEGDDDIRGSQGSDVLIGDLGNDRLQGGAGNDWYLFGLGQGSDRIENYASVATENDVLWMYGVNHNKLWFTKSGWDLQINAVGTNDQVKIANWYFNEALQLDAIYSGDRVLLRNQVDQLVNAMAGFNMPTGAGAVIPQAAYSELQPTLSVVWQQVA